MNTRIKTKLLALILIASCILSSACTVVDRKKDRKKYDHRSERDKDDDEDEDDEDEPEETKRNPHNVSAPDYLSGKSTWFDEQNLEFTPNGSFYMDVYSYGQFVQVPAYISIETNYDCEDGFKNIVSTTQIDMSASDYHFWTSSFDKYTGTSFEFHGDASSLFNGCDIIHEGDVPLSIGAYEYKMHILEHIEMQDDITTITYTITCPIEYDGTVLQYGSSGDTGNDYRDFESTSWLASDFTDMHGHYNYFTLQGLYVDAQ